MAEWVASSMSDREEPLEALPPLVEHAERCVARARQLAGHLEHATQHALDVELGDERPSDVEQPREPLLARSRLSSFASQ